MSDGFDGFPAGGLEFLTELGSQDKAWFDAHRATYQSEVAQPAKDFVVALTWREAVAGPQGASLEEALLRLANLS